MCKNCPSLVDKICPYFCAPRICYRKETRLADFVFPEEHFVGLLDMQVFSQYFRLPLGK